MSIKLQTGDVLRNDVDKKNFIKNNKSGKYYGETVFGEDMELHLIKDVGYEMRIKRQDKEVYESYTLNDG